MTRLPEKIREYSNAITAQREEISRLKYKIGEMQGLKNSTLQNLEVIDEDGRMIYTTTDYSLATEMYITEIWESDLATSHHWKEWLIHYRCYPDARSSLSVYCRHPNWGKDKMHLVAREEVSLKQGKWVLKREIGPGLDALTAFYGKQGVKPELLRCMEQRVADIRNARKDQKQFSG
ncbi:hypothetical protein HY501_02435 [Candidatus Woesearchaeota archaeon]|nr:hypothetical protein [Candidatus Woesearchaeota archaeon]